jgi:hypothetical protein
MSISKLIANMGYSAHMSANLNTLFANGRRIGHFLYQRPFAPRQNMAVVPAQFYPLRKFRPFIRRNNHKSMNNQVLRSSVSCRIVFLPCFCFL